MSRDIIKLNAQELIGPRSFFTDLDPNDPSYNREEVLLKLKLQLLTKEKIVIAASSMFTDVGCELFCMEHGLIESLEQGIIVPAIRNEFEDPSDFFQRYKYKHCSINSRNFFIHHVSHSIPWDLKENSSWFQKIFYEHLNDPMSLLRQKISMTESMIQDFKESLESKISSVQGDQKYLRREFIYSTAKRYGEDIFAYMSNYANLVYRISGSRVVNSESHFPQSNLTNLHVNEGDEILSDDSIFWDIYIETVVSYINSVVKLTPERLVNLSVRDILKIRKLLFDSLFSEEYDKLIREAKSRIDIHDPEKIILKQSEINMVASSLRKQFSERVFEELQMKNTASKENALWQLGNALVLISTPLMGLVIGTLSALQSIPEITSLVSEPLSLAMKRRYEWVRNYINCKVGWSREQKQSLLDGYRELLGFGIPK